MFSSKTSYKGKVKKELYDTKRLKEYRDAKENGVKGFKLFKLRWNAAKWVFHSNVIWRLLKKYLHIDVRIPLLTGMYSKQGIISNTVTTRGKQIAVEQLGGTTTAPVTAVAIGTGTPTATALGSEITTGGGARAAATVTNITTSTTGDTEQWELTFNFTSSFTVTEEGLFDNNTSGGNMFASQTFSGIPVANGDSLVVTHTVQAT